MKKTPKELKKLVLSKETLRHLTDADLRKVLAGHNEVTVVPSCAGNNC
jgi:hypothetical protein